MRVILLNLIYTFFRVFLKFGVVLKPCRTAIYVSFFLFSLTGYAQQSLQVVTEIFPPYQRYNAQGEIDGWSTRIVSRILSNSQLPYQITVYPWPRTYRIASNQPGALIYSLLRNKKRENLFHWVAPLCNIEMFFYRFSSRQEVSVSRLEDARKYIIGIGRDQPHREFLIDKGFIINENLVEVTSNEQLVKMMKQDRVDLIMASKNFIKALNASETRVYEELVPVYFVKEFGQQLYLAANKDTPTETVSILQKSYLAIKDDVEGLCND